MRIDLLAAGRNSTRWSERAAVPQDLEDQRTLASWEMIPLCKERMEMTLGSPLALSVAPDTLLGRSWSETMTIARD